MERKDRKEYYRQRYLVKRDEILKRMKKYDATPAGKATRERHKATDKCKATRRRCVKRLRDELKLFLDSTKLLNGCMNSYCPLAGIVLAACDLDFHHLHGKEKTISSLRTHTNKEGVANELSKCTVLCTICHRRHHAGIAAINIVGELKFPLDEKSKTD